MSDRQDSSQTGRQIAVVGSVNVDITLRVARAPRSGETVLADERLRGLGGKGANQAVASTRLGNRATLIACVGDDPDGSFALERLRTAGVDTTPVRVTAEQPTGSAFIVLEHGESTIVVAPGANGALSPGDVLDAGTVAEAAGLLCQLEVPLDAVHAAAVECSGLVVLNPAPARELPAELLRSVDVLVPNRLELATLLSAEPADDLDDLATQARAIDGPQAVVVTLGERGALAVTASESVHIPAAPGELVDATAAGDSFCAALLDSLLRGCSLADATRRANAFAALTVSHAGAAESILTFPTTGESK